MVRKKRETLAEGIVREAAEEQARAVERRRVTARVKAENALVISKARIAELEEQIAEYSTLQASLAYLEANPLQPHTIVPRERTGSHEATAVLLLSDLHLEETVDPAEINGINKYDLTIAAERMERLAEGVAWHLELARSRSKGAGYLIRDLMIPCLGDVTTNYLRMEDVHGNGLTPMEGLVFAEGLIVGCVRSILAHCPWLESIFMPLIPGNHDRMSFTKSTPFTKRVGLSSAPVLAHGIARELRDEPRFRIEMSPSEHHYTAVYGHTIRGIHGDRFNYQGGVGGIFIPARKHVASLNKQRHAHLTWFGHWHTAKVDDLWISNGSLIGPNAYSIGKGLDPEPPAQVFLLLDRDRGKRLVTPIQVSDVMGWS